MYSLIISLITVLLIIVSIIAFPNIKIKSINIPTYLIISVVGAVSLLILNLVLVDSLKDMVDITHPMNPLKILILFISMTILSIFLDEVGLFEYLANKTIEKVNKNQYCLFIGLYMFLSLLTIFTSNDIIILTFTPFICYYTKRANINPLPYIVSEFVASNTWSMVLIIGNPTNIYI